MPVPLDSLRDAAKKVAAVADDLKANKLDATLTLGDTRYFMRVERVETKIGRGQEATFEYSHTQMTIRESSNQGDVIYASPLEWM